MFAGPGGRWDGLKQMARVLFSTDVVEFDTLIDPEGCDIADDGVFEALMARIRAGEFFAAIIGTPCGSFSVARIRVPGEEDDGPVQLRDFEHPEGIDGLSARLQQQLDAANLLVERSVAVARAIHEAGGQFVIENPVTRSDPSTDHFRWRWRSHASLWMHRLVKALAAERWTRTVTFPQCALGGAFQKFTTLLFSVDLERHFSYLGDLRCTHERHAKQARGRDPDGKWRSAEAAAYPSAMNALLVEACVRTQRRFALHVGSAKPHAARSEAEQARPAGKPAPTASSVRRLEPEVDAVLRDEPMPAANLPPVAEWSEPPPPAADVPAPRATDDLIPRAMQQRLTDFRKQIGGCFEAARRGRWKWARDHRPQPLHATEEECLLPAARGWAWMYCPGDKLWHAMQPSRWPDDPPAGELDAAVAVQYAVEHGYSDMEIISFMAHGYPAPRMQRCALLGPPHVGTLKEPEAFFKMAGKDRERGWVRYGYSLPPVWPMRADPMNIVFRNGKPRMTIDKTMQLVVGVDSYNDCVDLDAQPAIEYVTVSMLGRASAILITAGVRVATWGFDLEAYFRKTGKQRADVWASGFVHHDGFGVDERVQFGQREAPVLTGRQSCFIVWAIRRELRRLDGEYPSAVPGVVEWVRRRLAAAERADGDRWWQWAALFFVLMFVDDVGGTSVDDPLVRADGSAWRVLRDGQTVQMTRAWLHYEAAVGVIRMFGHTDADGKGVTPNLDMVYLGVTIDVGQRIMSLSKDKCDRYVAEVESILQRRSIGQGRRLEQAGGGVAAPAAALASVMHKLLHAASVIPLGRQHLFHVMRSSRAETRLRGGDKFLGSGALRELEWWVGMLRREAPRRGVPLAVRTAFPEPDEPGVLVGYSDASREVARAGESGFGAWAIVAGEFIFVEGRWEEVEVLELDINVLELAAMNIGSFTFIAHAAACGLAVTHLFEFTDNTAAEHSAERGRPRSSRLGELICRRYTALVEAGISATAERVASVDNDVADGLSRGGDQLADALRTAAAAGYAVRRLRPLAKWRDTSYLIGM